MVVFGQGSWRWAVLLSAAACGAFGCAHASARGSASAALGAGRYAVESIRSRTTLGGREQLIELSETGTRVLGPSGDEHVLTERGALLLAEQGACRLALAVSVDGDAPGVSDRPCTWSVKGDEFFLGDGAGELRTLYRVHRSGDRLVLEGVVDVAADGRILGDAAGERIVLVQGPLRAGKGQADHGTAEPAISKAIHSPTDI
jgi:hypothetical protein